MMMFLSPFNRFISSLPHRKPASPLGSQLRERYKTQLHVNVK